MAFYKDKEQLLYIATSKLDKQTIEDGINRSLKSVTDMDGLIESMNYLFKVQGTVSVIITNKLPEKIKIKLEQIVKVFDELQNNQKKVTVFEIGLNGIFNTPYKFGDIIGYLEYVRHARRVDEIEAFEMSSDPTKVEQGAVMRELLVETQAQKERLKNLEQDKEDILKRLKVAVAENTDLSTKIEADLKVTIRELNELIFLKDEELDHVKTKLTLEVAKTKDYKVKYDKQVDELTNANAEIQALTKLHDVDAETKRKLYNEKERLKVRIDELEEEKRELLISRSDAEDALYLAKKLEKANDEIEKLKTALETSKIEYRSKELELQFLEQDLEDIRNGTTELRELGRTLRLGSCQLDGTNVYYFKFINDLPYVMSQIQLFAKMLKDRDGENSLHVMVLMNDEGLQSRMYSDLELYGNVGDVPTDVETFLLYPSPGMFANADVYSGKVKNLIVLDYIKSNEYYVKTTGITKIMTVVKKSSMISELGLSGVPISLDSGSKMNIRFDEGIERAMVYKTKQKMLQARLKTFLNAMGININ